MKPQRAQRNICMVLGLVTILFFVVSGIASAQLTGAIFTSDSAGTLVNANIYESKDDVYLNGGPPPNAPCTVAGLPDGDYYFQVTDPSGAVLLSADDISERKFRVSGGVISEYLGSTHGIGVGKCPGSISVQLIPYDDTPNPGGEYKVWVTRVTDYTPGEGRFGFVPRYSKTDNFKVRVRPDDDHPPRVTISGIKFYDSNTDGIQDIDEPGIFGWKITKEPPTPPDETTTDADGVYAFIQVPPGDYLISEIPPFPGWFPLGVWINTTPTSGNVTVNDGDIYVPGPDFGNVCLGPGGGRTLGFWSSKHGQTLFGADDLALMVGLNLRKANGDHFDPANYSAFRTWLRDARATNMAYMLSAQLSAMALNVHNGLVSGSAMVYAPELLPYAPISGLNDLGFISIKDLIAEANTELGMNGYTPARHPSRAYQEALKNVIDKANNNIIFVVLPDDPDFTTLCPILYED